MDISYITQKVAKYTGHGFYACGILWILFLILKFCGLNCSLMCNLFLALGQLNLLIFGLAMITLHQWHRY